MSTILVFAAFGTAGLVALTAVLYMFSFVGVPQTGVAARCLASYMALMACALIGVFSSLAMRLVGAEDSAQFVVARCFRWAMRLATGIVITVDDQHGTLQKTRPAVFIGNHQTELDVCMLGAVIPPHCSVTAKVSLRRIPILGWFMALSGTVFIDRKNSADARQAMAGAAETMRARRKSVYMFPEGTRSYSKEPVLLPFKKGAFHLAVQAQVPVVPVVVANYSHVLWVKGGVFKSGSIPCKVLDPISTKGLTAADVDELTRSTHELMLKELVLLTARARGHAAAAVPEKTHKNGSAKANGVDVLASAS